MLISRGFSVSFELESGKTIRAARGAELLHDPVGHDWPSDSVLVIAFSRSGKPLERVPRDVEKQFGTDYVPLAGRVVLPPRRGWTEVGLVQRVMYSRRGEHEGDFEHVFGEKKLLRRGKMPTLYRRSGALRLDGVSWDWGGAR